MRIGSVRIQNFRSFKDATVNFDSYTCLVGPNGAGKSAVLAALNLFFRNTDDMPVDLTNLGEEDFHNRDTGTSVSITVTFIDLNGPEQQEFKHYYRQGKLVFEAYANWANGSAPVLHRGWRDVMEAFKPFFEALENKAVAAELRKIYEDLRQKYPELPRWSSKDAAEQALRDHEEAHSELCAQSPSGVTPYGFTKGENRLAKFLQWVYVPAVKDATDEQAEAKNSALGKLIQRKVRGSIDFASRIDQLKKQILEEYDHLLKEHDHALQTVATALETRVKEWAHPGAQLQLRWGQDAKGAVRIEEPVAQIHAGEGDFLGSLARLGHGLQRSYLLALLQELASGDDQSAPRLILAVEEPELYQHPPQARHLAAVLQRLSEMNAQVMLCTHSPYFVAGKLFEHVRLLRRGGSGDASTASAATYGDLAAKITNVRTLAAATLAMEPPVTAPVAIAAERSAQLLRLHQVLQPALNEMFFTQRLVLVEGIEDVAYITTYLHCFNLWERCRRAGCHLIPVGGKSSMVEPFVVAKALNIPTYIVFDADTDAEKPEWKSQHKLENAMLLHLAGVASPDPWPSQHFYAGGLTVWSTNIGTAVGEEIGKDAWEQIRSAIDKRYSHPGNRNKNSLHIADSLDLAWEQGLHSPSLERLCNAIADFAETP